MAYQFNVFTGNLDITGGASITSWKPPVNTQSSLPASGNTAGDVRVAQDTGIAYEWSGSAWAILNGVYPTTVSSTSTPDGVSVDGSNNLTLHVADATNPGLLSTTAQSIAGTKTFTGAVNIQGATSTAAITATTLTAAAITDTGTASISGLASIGSLTVSGPTTLSSLQATGIVDTGNMSVTGTTTSTGVVYANGGVDTSTASTLAIGTTNATTINIGNPGATVNLQGTVINETATTLNVTNPTFVVNSGGTAGSGSSSGMTVEEGGSITGYVETSGDRNSWALKAPNTAGIVTLTPGSAGITINQSSHNPVTLGTANGLSLSTQQLSLGTASSTTTGALTSTDWTTFNSKQPAGNYITALTGDGTASGPGSVAFTLATVATAGTYPKITFNAKGLVTSGSALSSGDIPNNAANTTGNAATATMATTAANANYVNSSAVDNVTIDLSASNTIEIKSGGVSDAQVSPTAAIQLSKLATLGNSLAVVTNSSGILTTSPTTATQIGYLSNVTSDVQAQLNSKASTVAGDIPPTTFTGANNVSTPANITGFSFSTASIGSFKSQVYVHINATSSAYQVYEILGVYNGSGYSLSQNSAGQESGLVFTISSSGQMQYTSPNSAGWTSTTIRFRASTLAI